MREKRIIDEVMSTESVQDRPPVLIDVGARGGVLSQWSDISEESICVAFDPDKEAGEEIEEDTDKFKKEYVFSEAVVPEDWSDESELFLTNSPACSSLLQPNIENLRNYIYSNKFEISTTTQVSTTTLKQAMGEIDISYVDWFKTDSQGLDWRIFTSLPEEVRNSMIISEFEPGIVDAYHNEDKLNDILSGMDGRPYWAYKCDIKGVPRIKRQIANELGKISFKSLNTSSSETAGWAEIGFFNTFSNKNSKRDFLLGWVFATLVNQDSFAFELAVNGEKEYDDEIFGKLRKHSKREIQMSIFKRVIKNPRLAFKYVLNNFL